MKERHLLLSGGGTLGPVTPLLAVVEEARTAGRPYRFSWAGTADGPEAAVVERYGLPFFTLPSGKWHRFLTWRNLATPGRVLRGFGEARQIIRRLRPDAVVSAGGYVSVPLAWAARLAGVPVIVHEQDADRGLAAKLIAPFATLRTSVWPTPGAIAVGNLIRPSVLEPGRADEVRLHWRIEAGLPVLLVIGGGTGAFGLNKLVAATVPLLHRRAFVFHLTGYGKEVSSVSSPHYVQRPFALDELPDLFAAADLVVSRAGMAYLSELAARRLPAVVVPMPNSHQERNAERLERRGAAVVLHEATTTPEDLAEAVTSLLDDPARRAVLGRALHDLIPNGTAKFLELLDSVWRSG